MTNFDRVGVAEKGWGQSLEIRLQNTMGEAKQGVQNILNDYNA